MALWGGLSRQPDGREVLQLYVSADEVRRLLELGSDHYFEYRDEELDLDIGGRRITDVWLCVVPADESDPPRRC